MGRAAAPEVQRDGESSAHAGDHAVCGHPAAAPAWVFCVAPRAIPADAAARRPNAARRHHLVQPYYSARDVLAFVVGLHHSPDSYARAGAHSDGSREPTLADGADLRTLGTKVFAPERRG